jgi:hypothetical protein
MEVLAYMAAFAGICTCVFAALDDAPAQQRTALCLSGMGAMLLGVWAL